MSKSQCPHNISAQEYCDESHTKVEGCSCLDMMVSKTVFVSGISANHFDEAHDMIGSIQKHMPGTKIIIYNLGLEKRQLRQICRMCNVELRHFDFDFYPSHITPYNLKTYAWKPVIVGNVSREYEIVMWADASVRLKTSLEDFVFPYFLTAELTFVGHPNIPGNKIVQMTHDSTIKHLNVTREMLKGLPVIEANSDVFWLTRNVKKLVDEWRDCAMVRDCIAPLGSTTGHLPLCKMWMGGPEATTFTGCHRFDQSVLNIVIFKNHGRGVAEAIKPIVDNTLTLARDDTSHSIDIEYC